MGNTDETYSLNMHKYIRYSSLTIPNVLGTNIAAHIAFVSTYAIGAYIGEAFTGNLNYLAEAIPVITLLTLQIRNLEHVILAILAFFFTSLFINSESGNYMGIKNHPKKLRMCKTLLTINFL